MSAPAQDPGIVVEGSWRLVLTPRFTFTAAISTVLVGVISAIPTAIIDNPWFTRMTPIYANQYFYWIATSILAGILIATYFTRGGTEQAKGGIGGGLLGYLAIGCPICNKLIVGLLGVSGALDYFAPIQPLLGAVGVLLVAVALAYRLRGMRQASCPLPGAP